MKNQVQFDIPTTDVPRELERLQGLGASILSCEPGSKHAVMADPEGNEFCVISQTVY